MTLPDGPRQILAALLAAVAFLGLFFGAQLVWWAAFGLAVLVYAALLLIVGRRRPLDEVMVSSRVSEADIRRATAAMEASARRLTAAAEIAPKADQAAISEMSAHILSIRDKVQSDPQDYRQTRRFITSYLPHMVETVESYTDLARKARGNHADRLAPLAESIRSFGPSLEKIDQACLENDFAALEVQVDALATQMKRG